jgi:hypothetical protein
MQTIKNAVIALSTKAKLVPLLVDAAYLRVSKLLLLVGALHGPKRLNT